ncbi:DUF6325 family protein [Kitasatospora sp. NBC_01287]|uniref:DUF6325 family protein n=1 Tax=Kitasatospora sp. NBC_01287 TaxID=2903573 RepID=UPI002252E32C|nr:DUF6325 family protein [Kitasatospora sp. NBC_01287]MCX4750391.1 DUF6325 family protein [Kitasatospora sp. NBC_01287]
MDVGPVEYVVIAFPGNHFRGEIEPELRRLVESGTVRILDLTFIKKDAEGLVSYQELEALGPDEASVFDNIDGEVGGLLSEQDLELVARELAPDSAAALIVWEDTWAAPIAGAIRRAGGLLVEHERIPGPVVAQALAAAAG